MIVATIIDNVTTNGGDNHMRTSMTYGKLPSEKDFDAAFDKEIPDKFHFKNDPRVGSCELSSSELFVEVQKAHAEWDRGDDHAGDWCARVLECLEFEWI